ncbi:MAG: hypothetical protein CMK09_07180 [Ponticaulis sp.]|nr:hypothetical protein [Ponticaulis sp.]|tara:strand:- start:20713 stop:21903 length:1191 start_codon:yes stop_codon:yes gene_type:complete
MRFLKSKLPSSKSIESALRAVSDPASGKPLPDSGRIDSLIVSPKGDVALALSGSAETQDQDERLRYEVEQIVSNQPKVGKVSVMLTSHSDAPAPRAAPAQPASSGTRRVEKGSGLASDRSGPAPGGAAPSTLEIPGVKNIIAVASAKGGVGKSTLALNLAIGLAERGLKIGVLDADVYGPSIPTMTGTVEASPTANDKGKLIPIEAFGLKLMSIGYVSDVDAPMIWRGPVVMSALTQMMKDVDWGELDLLILDTPPGTGDVQLTLAQRIKLSGAIIVSTPQEVALADVRRGVAMFGKTGVPVLGIVENMSWFEDPVSGNRSYLFGEGGARQLADKLEISLLGEVPLVQGIREGGDNGLPAASDSETVREVYLGIADRMLEALSVQTLPPAPEIIFE